MSFQRVDSKKEDERSVLGYNFIVTAMFEGQRLTYVVPGYTGHIPSRTYEEFQPLGKESPSGKIPGYAGYVPSIKPENLYASTFGKTTLDVSSQQYVKGQDFQPRDKYVTTTTTNFLPPSERFQRTAANIVGVPDTRIEVPAPRIDRPGKETDQFSLSKQGNFYQTVKGKDGKWAQSKVVEREGKEYVELGEPLPGYTGFGKRVLANNIFGRTYAECMKEAKRDDTNLHHDKQKNFNSQLNSHVPFKF